MLQTRAEYNVHGHDEGKNKEEIRKGSQNTPEELATIDTTLLSYTLSLCCLAEKPQSTSGRRQQQHAINPRRSPQPPIPSPHKSGESKHRRLPQARGMYQRSIKGPPCSLLCHRLKKYTIIDYRCNAAKKCHRRVHNRSKFFQ